MLRWVRTCGGKLATIVAFALSVVWALAVPIGPAPANLDGNWQPDERSHILTVRWWAEHGSLPPYGADYAVSVHPPLYHILAVPSERWFGVLGMRLFSALLGAATVWYTFRAGRALYGSGVGALAAWFVALVPMRASLAGGVSNENLAALGATATLAVLAESVRRGRVQLSALCLWCAVGVLSKLTCLGLLPAVVLGVGWRFGGRALLRTAVGLTATVLLPLGGWLVANQSRCGDALCKSAADRLWDGVQPGYDHYRATRGFSPARYLFKIVTFGWRSFWGAFDALQKHFPLPLYLIVLGLQGVSLTQTLAVHRRRAHQLPHRLRRARESWWLATGMLLLTTSLIFVLFNWRHLSPQGRYFYVLLAPFGIATSHGFLTLWPKNQRARATRALVLALLALNLWCLWRFAPAFASPAR